MSIVHNDNFKINVGKPTDSRYLNLINIPFESIGDVNTTIPISYRYTGLTVNILGEEYWYKSGVTNVDLLLKSFAGTTYTGSTYIDVTGSVISAQGLVPETTFNSYTASTSGGSGGSGNTVVYIEYFVSTGQTTFTVTGDTLSVLNFCEVNGNIQKTGIDFTISSNDIIFTSQIPSGSTVGINYFSIVGFFTGGSGGSGTVTGTTNLGGGIGIATGITGADLNFKSLSGGSGINLSSDVEAITIINSLYTPFNTYTGTTAPATYLSLSNFNTWSGSTNIALAENGLTKINTKVKLGGTITGNTNISLGTNILSLTGTSSSVKTTDLFISNQAATSSDQRPIYIDNTGKLQKSAFINLDETEQIVTFTGKDNLELSPLANFENIDNDSVMKVYNGFIVEFGGTSALWEVATGITSDNAGWVVNDKQAKALKLNDQTGNEFWNIKTTTGTTGLNNIFKQKVVNNYGLGFSSVRFQAIDTTDTTNNGWTNIIQIPLAINEVVHVAINSLTATATGDEFVFAFGNMQGFAQRDVGGPVTSTSLPAYTMTGTDSVNWRMIANNTSDKSIDIDFQNGAVGKTWTVTVDGEYIIRQTVS